MAASTVSKESEGIYTDLASPGHDVYSTLGQSVNSPRAQHLEKSGQSSHPYRLAAVCLGLLCALLLAATLVLGVLCDDVYSTLGQTSLNSPRSQHTEKSGQSSHPYRLAAVCLGLLCALLLAATLVLGVPYGLTRERGLGEFKGCNRHTASRYGSATERLQCSIYETPLSGWFLSPYRTEERV
ncbi:hypothetical protein SKAU_G00089910 [Synaphobranchus kaupii]|uniref:Uncharacterized protein n=1 Tax=Synaphobranchus kaupii TaxID=118154 RepID=A0A9Q1FWB2_SYNKA|nr:hypothetical protein SKAU_G00089910 [Synaphobranchus kaupii]